jgi:tRNA A-37 threonylcarbamoyl transferase component Bud32/tetratricopeptide (TPR) repeat protein
MSEGWERIQNVFLEAAELPPDERVRFLDTACARDPELRREVESLLAYDGADARRIEDALEDTAQSLFESEGVTGARLGAWRVLQEIGRGGMGAVYLATRDDAQFQKRVAIKVVKRGMDTAELLSRFRRERQILANLDHTYIARLIDGGSTPEGRPFLVMEYVEGRPIDVYCRELGLDIEARCRLFLKVCEAVSYAHRNLVIHRDLKPDNILVAANGEPKLVDFGVAKLLDTELDSGLTTITAGRLLTPEYASPEQVRGQLIGAASDIYALGTILYELLTGTKAQRVESHTPAELERVICETEVQPPSARVEPANSRLRKRLSGDLDNIVLMAMRKEPERRYSSVDLFAEDVRRHLEGRTVTARRDSFSYRFGKHARRNRLWLAGASLVAVSMVGGTWTALSEAHHARIEQRRAEVRLSQMVELANRALFDVHGSIERLPGATDARRKLVGTTLDYLEKLSKDAGDDERLRKALGAAYYRLGDLQGYALAPNLGDTAGAIKSYQSSAAILNPLRRAHPNDAEVQRLWLETQTHLASVLEGIGDTASASRVLRDRLPAAAVLSRLPGAGLDAQRLEGEFYELLATAAKDRVPGEALTYARRYLDIFSGLARRYPDRADFVLEQSTGYSLVGLVLHAQADSHGALAQFRQCVALREALVEAHPHDVVYKRNLMIGYGHIGDTLGGPAFYNLGDSEGARSYYRRAVAIGEEIFNADPRDSTAKFDLAAGLGRLGMVDVAASGIAESLAALQRSVRMLETLVVADPNKLSVKIQLARAEEYTGHRLRGLGRYAEAIAGYRRSMALADSMLEADPTSRVALAEAVASGRGMATAMAMAGDRAGSLREAGATIARAQAGVSAGPDKRSRQRFVAESTMELGSIYGILAKQAPASHERQDWEAARSALHQATSQLEAMVANGKLTSVDTADAKRAQNLLTEAEEHLSASRPTHP